MFELEWKLPRSEEEYGEEIRDWMKFIRNWVKEKGGYPDGS